MRAWFIRTLRGCQPADEAASAVLDRIPHGTTFEAEVITRRSRSGAWHRRYWALANLIASNCEQVEIEPGVVLPITDAESAHVAIKYLTGLYDSYVLEGGNVVRLLKSTAFDKMGPDEWSVYWQRVVRAVHERILPGIEIAAIEEEIAQVAS